MGCSTLGFPVPHHLPEFAHVHVHCFCGGSAGNGSPCNAGDLGSIPGLGRSPGEGNSYPLQYSGLENSIDCIVYGVTESQTRLSDFHSHVHCIGDAIQPSHPLPPSFPSAFNLSQHHGLLQWVSCLHQVAKVLALQLQHPKSIQGLSSFKIDWFDLFAFQGTLKSLLQCYSSKASTLQCSAFFMVQLSDPYMTTGKATALTIWTFAGKEMSAF